MANLLPFFGESAATQAAVTPESRIAEIRVDLKERMGVPAKNSVRIEIIDVGSLPLLRADSRITGHMKSFLYH